MPAVNLKLLQARLLMLEAQGRTVTQTELAKACGVSQPHVSQVLRGVRAAHDPFLERAIAYLDTLEVTP